MVGDEEATAGGRDEREGSSRGSVGSSNKYILFISEPFILSCPSNTSTSRSPSIKCKLEW